MILSTLVDFWRDINVTVLKYFPNCNTVRYFFRQELYVNVASLGFVTSIGEKKKLVSCRFRRHKSAFSVRNLVAYQYFWIHYSAIKKIHFPLSDPFMRCVKAGIYYAFAASLSTQSPLELHVLTIKAWCLYFSFAKNLLSENNFGTNSIFFRLYSPCSEPRCCP